MKIVLDAGYHSWVGIEYEGQVLPEKEGIGATLRLLRRVHDEMRGAVEPVARIREPGNAP